MERTTADRTNLKLAEEGRPCSDAPRFNRTDAAFIAFVVAVAGIVVFTATAPVRLFGHDLFIYLDGGYRVLQGQLPHRDFYSPWGPLLFLFSSLGLWFGNLHAESLRYMIAVLVVVGGAWCYLLARFRLGDLRAIALAVYTVLLAAAPTALGGSAYLSTYALAYNRWAYALSGIVLIEALIRPTRPLTTWARLAGGASSGAAAVMLIFLKPSYGIAAVGLLICSFIIAGGRTKARVLGLFATGATLILLMLVFMRFEVRAAVRDLEMAAGARSVYWSIAGLAFSFVKALPQAVPAAVLAFFAKSNPESALRHETLLAAAITICADAFLLSTNMQWHTAPLCVFFGLAIGLSFIVREGRSSARMCDLPVEVVAFGALLIIPVLTDVVGLGAPVWGRFVIPGRVAARQFEVEPLAALRFAGVPDASSGPSYAAYINDGIRILRDNTSPQEGVFTLDMSNPFNYATGRPSPKGGAVALLFNGTVSTRHHPSAECLFGSAPLALVPKKPALERGYYDGLVELYLPAIRQQFVQIAESEWWLLFRRKAPPKACPASSADGNTRHD